MQLTERGGRERERDMQKNFFDFSCKRAHMERAWFVSLEREKHFEFYKAVKCQNFIFTSHSFMGQIAATESGIMKCCLLLHADKVLPGKTKNKISMLPQQLNSSFQLLVNSGTLMWCNLCQMLWALPACIKTQAMDDAWARPDPLPDGYTLLWALNNRKNSSPCGFWLDRGISSGTETCCWRVHSPYHRETITTLLRLTSFLQDRGKTKNPHQPQRYNPPKSETFLDIITQRRQTLRADLI